MKWVVTEKAGLHKRIRKLPEKVQNLLIALMKDIEANGPVRGDWPNFSGPIRRPLSLPFEERPSYIRSNLGS